MAVVGRRPAYCLTWYISISKSMKREGRERLDRRTTAPQVEAEREVVKEEVVVKGEEGRYNKTRRLSHAS